MSKSKLKTCNLDYLYELAKGDTGFVREMIDVFLADNSEELNRLETSIKDKNFEQVRQISHKLRSSIPYMGLDSKIGEEIIEMEELARKQEDIKKIETLSKKVRKVCNAAIEELREIKL